MAFALHQNYPNPFNPSTVIPFSIPHRSRVEILVFNVLGQKVAELVDGQLEAGAHQVRFDASRLASGVYFCRMRAGGFVRTERMIMLR